MPLLNFWMAHRVELGAMIERHLFLVLWSTLVAIAIGLPAGIIAAHRPRIGRPVLAVASIAQTIPSLALLGFLLPLPFIGGVGPRIAIVAGSSGERSACLARSSLSPRSTRSDHS